jgi:hypothetical protein
MLERCFTEQKWWVSAFIFQSKLNSTRFMTEFCCGTFQLAAQSQQKSIPNIARRAKGPTPLLPLAKLK